VLEQLGDSLAHRGPDDSGIYQSHQTGLVHRRLAIIDLSPAGHGPMCNEEGTIWLTFNGEIYNYRELIPDLERAGHRFKSHSDTEVIIHAYEAYGERCVERLNGMFAFAIWDEQRAVLFCARDRAGVKPFYYTLWDGFFAFASEIKALAMLPGFSRAVDDQVVYEYLVHGYVDHTDATFFQHVKPLPAANSLVLENGNMRILPYWRIPCPDLAHLMRQPTPTELDRLSEDFATLLHDSIRLRLRSDVTVGSCLSGGLDSSAIVCTMSNLLFGGGSQSHGFDERWFARGDRQKTFSACYDDPAIDERAYVNAVTHATGAEAHVVYPRGEDLVADLQQVIWHQDEPFLGTSIFAQWYVMKLAHQTGVKVLLDGQGADELLCGYPGYFGPYFADLLVSGQTATLLREMALFDRYTRGRWGSGRLLMARALRARHGWLRPQLRSRLDPSRLVPAWVAPGLMQDGQGRSRRAPMSYSLEVPGYLSSMSHWLFTRGSLPGLLRYEDRNSMAFGVESRVPFLDYRLIEFVFSTPNAARMGDGRGKRVLRRSSRRLIPAVVSNRRDKLGFTTPEDVWLRGPAQDAVLTVLTAPSVAAHGYLQPGVVRDMALSFMRGAPIASALIWRWTNLELWLSMYVDGVLPPARNSLSDPVAAQ
jgi:asparagine synthase (glutamine-hydrolysing)